MDLIVIIKWSLTVFSAAALLTFLASWVMYKIKNGNTIPAPMAPTASRASESKVRELFISEESNRTASSPALVPVMAHAYTEQGHYSSQRVSQSRPTIIREQRRAQDRFTVMNGQQALFRNRLDDSERPFYMQTRRIA